MTKYHLSQEHYLSAEFLQQLSNKPDMTFLMPQAGELITKPGFIDGVKISDSGQEVISDHTDSGMSELILTAEGINLEKLWQFQQAAQSLFTIIGWAVQPSIDGQGPVALVARLREAASSVANDDLDRLCSRFFLEGALIEQRPSLHKPGLLVMDMDSTLIDMECIDEIARLSGVGEQVSEVTELAMEGKMDFEASLRSRVACLKGTPAQDLAHIREQIPLMPGVQRLCSVLKQHGWKLVIASGGFTYFADYLQQRLSLDLAVSNQLKIVDGLLTGEVEGQVVDGQKKASVLCDMASEYGIERSQTIALGDGANDLLMMEEAGLGVAYHAKPLVREKAQASIRLGGTDILLHYLSQAR